MQGYFVNPPGILSKHKPHNKFCTMAGLKKLAGFFLVLVLFSSVFVHADEEVKDEEPAKETKEEETTEQTTEEGESSEETTREGESSEGSDEVKEEDDVLVLNKNNFDKVVNEKDIILVEFYAPWCGHCKSLAPEYAKAATTLKQNDPPVSLAKVDATQESDLASKYDVSGYPTLKVFRKGKAFDYDGPREKNGIVKYMAEQADPNWKPPPEAVITLTKENFADTVNSNDLMLVEFYAPWCGHCKSLAPEYEKAAKELKKNDPPIPLAKVDATKETELAKEYDVSGYPTLKIFRKGKASEYKGERNQWGITSYMQNQVGPSSKILSSLKAVTDFQKDADDLVILGFFENDEDKLLETYYAANNDLRDDYKFGHTFDAAAKKRFNIKKSSIIMVHPEKFRSTYEPKHVVFEGTDPKPEDIQKFYKDNLVPLVGQMFKYNERKRYTEKRPLCVAYYDVDFGFDNRVATEFWRQKILKVAKDFKDVTFAIASEEEYEDKLKDLGLDDSGEEINIGCFDDKGRKYKMEPDDEFSEDSLREFIEEFKAGNIKPQIKSQPVPKKQKGPVTVVVGKNFDDVVLDSSKDVLLEMYAPWCGHCKALEPTYKKLAKHFKDAKDLVIAKIDATANDAPPQFTAEGFPTIYFAPANNKKSPMKYEGERELKDFITFLKENATVKLGKAKKEEL